MRVPKTLMALSVAGTLAAVPAPHSVGAAADLVVANWEMNEAAGASVLVDSGPNGIHGSIGRDVVTGDSFDGATGHRFVFVLPNQPPANPERLDQVPHDDRLNPGTQDFAVTVRLWTKQNFGNVAQKGQNGAIGGYWKIEIPNGRATCLFLGSARRSAVRASPDVLVNDQRWHTIRCERTAQYGVRMIIDGVHVTRNAAQPGNVANTRPLTIAGKVNCNQDTITCDYFVGRLDYVRIESS